MNGDNETNQLEERLVNVQPALDRGLAMSKKCAVLLRWLIYSADLLYNRFWQIGESYPKRHCATKKTMLVQKAEPEFVDILIAEDDELMRHSLRRILEGEGYRCSEASDGRAAVESALRVPPRCAILDLTMPVLDGFGVARALRLNVRTRGIRLNCLTGRTDTLSCAEATRAGIENFLAKPLEPTKLLQIVHEQLDHPRTLQASGLSLTAAREQLDLWEHAGYANLEAVCEDGRNFTVRCVVAAHSA